MPALIMRSWTPKNKSRPGAAFDPNNPVGSTFRVLLAPPCLVESDLLSLDLARVARNQPCGAECRLECRIILDEGARDAVANRPCLAALAPAEYVHPDVEGRGILGELERLAYDHAA